MNTAGALGGAYTSSPTNQRNQPHAPVSHYSWLLTPKSGQEFQGRSPCLGFPSTRASAVAQNSIMTPMPVTAKVNGETLSCGRRRGRPQSVRNHLRKEPFHLGCLTPWCRMSGDRAILGFAAASGPDRQVER